MLKTYDEFLAYAEQCGVMAFSGKYPAGLPVLDKLTSPLQWHTGDTETDPWRWKDRAAQEKKLAFGNILGGNKGFISKALYPLFYSACRPDWEMEDRYQRGYVKRLVLDVYRLFQEGQDLDTGEIRRAMNVSKKEGASAVDGVMNQLQREFYITVCGNRRKVARDGLEYGWPANCYCLVDDWAAEWLKDPLLPTAEAKEQILSHCAGLDHKLDLKALEKLLFKQKD
jgi:hypothetical protein